MYIANENHDLSFELAKVLGSLDLAVHRLRSHFGSAGTKGPLVSGCDFHLVLGQVVHKNILPLPQ